MKAGVVGAGLGLCHPIGRFAMMNIVASDLCLEVREILHDVDGERSRPPTLLKQRVAAGLGGGGGRAGWGAAGPNGQEGV